MWKRHLDMHNMLWEGLRSMDLKPFVEKEEVCLWGVKSGTTTSLRICDATQQSIDIEGHKVFVLVWRWYLRVLRAPAPHHLHMYRSAAPP